MNAPRVGAGDTPKHIPGPWRTRLHSSQDGAHVVFSHGYGAIAEAYAFPRISRETAAANAAMIAAAPDLLAALKNLANCDGHMDEVPDYSAAHRAIAKAEGQQ